MDALLEQIPPELRAQIQSVLAERDRLLCENSLLRQAIRLLQIDKYGPRSEKLSDEQLNLLEGEPSVTAAEVEQEAQAAQKEPAAPPPKRERNQNHPGRTEFPPHLERRELIIPCDPKEIACPHCGEERPLIGYEISEELDVEPAVYFVRVTKREKRASHCLPEEGVVTAPAPPKILPKSKLSNELIIEALVAKYQEHKPAYRQCAILEREAGVELSRQTLVGAILWAGQLLGPVVQVLKKDLLGGGYIQADETPVACQGGQKPGKNHQAFMWEYSRPGGPVVFDFQMGRSRAGPLSFLEGFSGKLQTDGYAVYDKLGKGIVYVGCWSHARRQIHRAHQLSPKDPVPLELLGTIGELYRIEQEARTAGLSHPERLQKRQELSVPIAAGLKKRLLEVAQGQPPGSQLAKACKYALGQWTRLEEVFRDGALELDNNWCENAIRGLAVGRKNWLHIGSEQAGPKVAAIASIVESCRRLEINLRAYLKAVLPKLPEWPISRVAELSPLAWKAVTTP